MSKRDPLAVPERAWQVQIESYARLQGWVSYSVPDSRRATDAGFPDVVLCHARWRKVAFVELKTDDGRVRPAQRTWLNALAAVVGVDVFLWRPNQWEHGVRDYLDGKELPVNTKEKVA